ncbi:MAG: hypothetical protein FVQ80_10860 [Planctomycetes bacterium]|nr:hypothetical protein [Planctomycetota bacterium]
MTFRKTIFVILALSMAMIFIGCQAQQGEVGQKAPIAAAKADLVIKYEAGQTGTYKSVVEFRKDYKFEQPSINKTTEKVTTTVSQITFDQTIEEVDDKGNAVANITVKVLKYRTHSQQGAQVDFDSTRDEDAQKPLMAVIGESYKIKLSPAGKVIKVVNTKKIRNLVKQKESKQIAKIIFGNENIKKAHSILAMPDAGKSQVAVGDNWSRIKASPKGMLQPKNYEKVYTLENVARKNGKNIASIKMEAMPTSKRPAKADQIDDQGMGIFAKMFAGTDNYKGHLILDLDNAKINSYSEKLVATWVAAEPPEEQRTDRGPDVLTMGFTWVHSLEAID